MSQYPAGGSTSAPTTDTCTRSTRSPAGLLWRSSAQDRLGGLGAFYATPAVAYGRVYVANTDGKVYSYGATQRPDPVVVLHRRLRLLVAGGVEEPRLRRLARQAPVLLRRSDGACAVALPRERLGAGRADAVIDGLVYFSTATGRTYALDARTGKLRWFWRDGQYTPVASDGRRLYLVGYSRLYAMVPKCGFHSLRISRPWILAPLRATLETRRPHEQRSSHDDS